MSKGEIKQRYVAVAVGHNINPGDDTKSPTVEVEMRVLEPEPFKGKTVYLYLSLKEGQAQEITAKTLRTLGWKCNDITALEGLGSVTVDMNEREEDYKGKPQKRYDVWARKGPRASLRSEDMASFANRFKALAASTPVSAVGEHNAAPAVIPEAAKNPAANGGATATTGAADPTQLFS